MIHNHEGTEAWKQGVYDAVGAMQEEGAGWLGDATLWEMTDRIMERLGLQEVNPEQEGDDP